MIGGDDRRKISQGGPEEEGREERSVLNEERSLRAK